MPGTGNQSTNIDPITFELIKNAITSIVDEMVLTIVRTAYSGVIKSVLDFSTAFCDARGQTIAQGLSLPLHLGSVPDAMQAILRRFEGDIHPGDVYVLNDPEEGGMHLPDIYVFKPVFLRDDLLGFAVTLCHHTDVGGRVAGSNASDSTEIYQEGLRIPPLRLYERGRPNTTLFRIIEQNVRVPVKVLGDIRAQLAACHVAEQQFLRLVERHGKETLQVYLEHLLDYTERLTRAELATWPDGEYEFTDYLDDDGIDPDPIPIKVKLTVKGDELEADFDGSAPQVKGAINCTLSFTKAAVYAAVKLLLGPDIPNNEGFFRPIKVRAPERSITNTKPPAAFAARGVTGFRLGDTLLGALAQIRPDLVFAAGEGGNSNISIGGYDKDYKPFVYVDFTCSSWGARPNKDGIDGITNPFENLANEPAEVVEAEHPIRIEQYGFIPDSGGPGRFRGGLGIVREYRLLEKEATLQIRSDRRKFRPYGLNGGRPGAPSCNIFNPDTDNMILPAKVTMTMRQNDVLRHLLPGGGGHGYPWERDVALVLDDVRNEKVTVEGALRDYGVVIDPETLQVDEQRTYEVRRRMREQLQE